MNNEITEITADMRTKQKFHLSSDAKSLAWCFGVPFLVMIAVYCALMVWPVGKNSVLVLDLNAQYIYYFEQLRDVLTTGESLIYSFERALGGEFMGIFAYYLSSPFSLIVALFPKDMITEAMYLILVLKTGFCGLAFGYYLKKNCTLTPVWRVIFSTMYALSAYVVVMQHNVMWIDNVIAFPLLLLGMDELIKHGRFKLYTFALVYAVFSNFYIGYMTCIFTFIWFFVRYFMLSPKEKNPLGVRYHFMKSIGRIALWSAVGIMISAIIILPTYYSLSFGKLEFSDPKYTPKQMFEFADIITKAFFGSYDTVRPSGMPFIYCGTLSLVLAPLYFFADDIPLRKKIGMAFMMLLLIASFNFSIFDIIWHGMQRPNWLNSRFSYMFSGLMVIMAAETTPHLPRLGRKTVTASAVLWCALLIILAKFDYDNLPDFMAVWPGILCFVLIAAALPSCIKALEEPGTMKKASAVLCGIIIAEAMGNSVVMLYQLDDDVTYSKRSSYRQMIDTYEKAVDIFKDDDSSEFYRAEKLVHRKKNDNFALDINGMSNSTSTLNARAVDLLSQFGYAAMSHWSMFSGATAVTDALFDIKYLIADESDDKAVMDYIHDLYTKIGSTDDELDVYKNPYALSIAYSVNEEILEFDVPVEDEEGVDNYIDPFNYMNKLLSAMTGENIKVWNRAEVSGSDDQGVDMIFVTGHRGYEANDNATPKLTWKLEIESSDRLYAYFPSKYPREATINLNGEDLGTYFDGEDFSLRELGSFEEGEEITVALYLEEDNIYLRTGVSYFYHFDEQAFIDAMELLSRGTMDAYSQKDDRIFGIVNVPEGDSVMFTTIPYDKGWRVTVDGRETETLPAVRETLLAFRITPGEHEIVLEYRPDCVKYGLILSLTGIVIFAAACVIDTIVRKKKTISESGITEDEEIIPDSEIFENTTDTEDTVND